MQSPLAYEREGYDVRHIRELFGDVRLTSLMPDDYGVHMQKPGKPEGSPKASFVVFTQNSADYAVALENELIHRNPCVSIKLPKRDGETRQALTLQKLNGSCYA